jgi:hypothetical protein
MDHRSEQRRNGEDSMRSPGLNPAISTNAKHLSSEQSGDLLMKMALIRKVLEKNGPLYGK